MGISWWPEEQLSVKELEKAIALYKETKPQIVASHDGPQSIITGFYHIFAKSRTRMALDAMLEAHQPRMWVFAHHHISWKKQVGATLFQCLEELETLEVTY